MRSDIRPVKMMPHLNYNSMDLRRSTESNTDDSPEDIENRYVHIESFELPIENPSVKQTTPLLNGRSLRARLFAFISRSQESYDNLSDEQKRRNPLTIRRTLGAFGGVFATIALGQFATAIFLRTGEDRARCV